MANQEKNGARGNQCGAPEQSDYVPPWVRYGPFTESQARATHARLDDGQSTRLPEEAMASAAPIIEAGRRGLPPSSLLQSDRRRPSRSEPASGETIVRDTMAGPRRKSGAIVTVLRRRSLIPR